MSNKKEDLGKGIRALLQGIDEEVTNTQSKLGSTKKPESPKGEGIFMIKIDEIEINPFQPRVNFNEESLQELSKSIKVHGVIQPISIKKLSSNKYQLIAGERRLRASKLAGLDEIPAFVRSANDQESLEIALIENIQREDLNAIEIGLNYQRLIDECDLTHEGLSDRLGKKRTTITNYLRLLKLPPDIQAGIRTQEISMGHARALIGVEQVDVQLDLFKQIKAKGLSVRQVEKIVRGLSSKKKSSPKSTSTSLGIELQRIQDQLSSNLGTNVKLKPGKDGSGEIIITYYSDSDLGRLNDMLTDD